MSQQSVVSLAPASGAGLPGQSPLGRQAANGAARENEWRSMLGGLGLDERVWEIVAGIFELGEVEFEAVTGDKVQIGSDLFGFPQRTFARGKKRRPWRETLRRVNGGLLLTRAGWQEAMPVVQQALDHLNIAFAANQSGLICRRGRHAVESVYTDDGLEYKMFDCDHGSSDSYAYCRTSWSGRDLASVRKLPVRRTLVLVEGWSVCKSCQVPIRPLELRSVARPPIAA